MPGEDSPGRLNESAYRRWFFDTSRGRTGRLRNAYVARHDEPKAGVEALNDSVARLMTTAMYGIHNVIAGDARIGEGTRIGNFVFIRDHTVIGQGCVVGSYVDIEGDVTIGNFVSLQSGCYLTRGVIIEDEVFCGPRIVTMNDKPMSYRRPSLTFVRRAPRILRAARVGGGSILCPGITVGENAVVGAGSVVVQDVPDRSIVMGNPARVVGEVEPDVII
jgi:UDP-2-acetamido-3-amino-2,3-dideoxy-glucuronate N-acetyltransferase